MLEPIAERGDEGDLPPESALVQTHGGLTDLDPWAAAPRRAPLRALWPWGLSQLSETLEVIALAVLMFLAVRAVGQNFVVDGLSMLPTFRDGELLIVNRLAYRTFDLAWIPGIDSPAWRPFGEPQLGDIVVFEFPRNPDRDFIKRVIALPGQMVEVRDGFVYVDGVALDEPYTLDVPAYPFGPEVVPLGHIFVLGDNRNNSYDSHSWGMLDTSLIIGRADIRYWPVGRMGLIRHDRPQPAGSAEVEREGQRPAPGSVAIGLTGALGSP
jgi:signal peptidase I